jgi:hypothetical protein
MSLHVCLVVAASLGLLILCGGESVQVSAHVATGAKTRVAIATPKGASIISASCPGARVDQTGLLMGVVRDVDSGTPLSGARVASRWFEPTFDQQGRHYEILETAASTDPGGVFRLCGVPSDTEATLEQAKP